MIPSPDIQWRWAGRRRLRRGLSGALAHTDLGSEEINEMNRELSTSCGRAVARSLDWIAARMQANGRLGEDYADLACYYKPPYLMQLADRTTSARRLLDYVAQRFQQPDGDFRTTSECRGRHLVAGDRGAAALTVGDRSMSIRLTSAPCACKRCLRSSRNLRMSGRETS